MGVEGCIALAYVGKPLASVSVKGSSSTTWRNEDGARFLMGMRSSEVLDADERTESGRGTRESSAGNGDDDGSSEDWRGSDPLARDLRDTLVSDRGESLTGMTVITSSRARNHENRLFLSGRGEAMLERLENMLVITSNHASERV